ncbi:hypothetical protein LGR54_24685 [Ancylobacter sp. Lp-2]|uniref:hypothetical protein n=1 Tax=Ancylobacter sp. Lp-2 TaxID=2881339 RepID=UPI001E51171B|nr:hypothetical protein [Ancylobacter sp. Lp-2]MCB4771813.1 hypothetical protein [Ancylobacter sp. Lp-2]
MTAIIAMTQSHPNRVVHLATDSLAVTDAGRVNMPKIATIPHLSAAIAATGAYSVASIVVHELCRQAQSLPAAAKALPDALRRVKTMDPTFGEQAVVLAGLADGKAQIWYCATLDQPDLPAFEAKDVGTFFATPIDHSCIAKFHLPNDTDYINPTRDFPRYMGVIRDADIKNEYGEKLVDWVGGPVVLTSISADRIEQRPVGVVPEVAARRGLLGRWGL